MPALCCVPRRIMDSRRVSGIVAHRVEAAIFSVLSVSVIDAILPMGDQNLMTYTSIRTGAAAIAGATWRGQAALIATGVSLPGLASDLIPNFGPPSSTPFWGASILTATLLFPCWLGAALIGDHIGGRLRRCSVAASRTCGRCTYDLTGNVSGCCPECGAPSSSEPRP